jgi:hypothetical protein
MKFPITPDAVTDKSKLAAIPQQLEPRSDRENKAFLDEKELLARLPICRRTAFNWIQQGKLPCVKIGRRKIFHWPSVEAALLRLQRGMN